MSFYHAKLSFLFLFASLSCGCSRADEGLTNVKDAFSAAFFGEIDSLKSLLKGDPDLLKARNEVGETLVHYAAEGNQPEIVRYLIGRGAEVDARSTKRKQTPLHCAAGAGTSFEAAKVLIELGADVNARPEFRGEMPIEGSDDKVVLEHYGKSVLEEAASSGDYRLVELLIKKDVNTKDERSPLGSALHHACLAHLELSTRKYPENVGNRKVIELLTSHIDINTRDKLKRTPLHYAAGSGAVEIVKYLVSTYDKIDLNANDNRGNTPLHLAVSGFIGNSAKDRAEVIKILVKAGADVTRRNFNLKNSEKLTPQELAEKLGNKTIIEAFKTE